MSDSAKLEIGCGVKPLHRSSFLGVDRFPLPGVDVVCDLDKGGIPFPDDYFGLVYASHSLEHVRDLMAVMTEIWRVCRPGAQLCIVAPYYSTALNYANPYHFQSFNEHTPRFWTSCPATRIDQREWADPFVWELKWGLAPSDNSEQVLDFRCLRMEFFYYSPFARKTTRKKRALRRSRNNVCHSLMYHLVAFKPPMLEQDVNELGIDYYIPPEIQQIRVSLAYRPIRKYLGRKIGRLLARRSQ
jgi:SAM-dependent methyltransferase